MKTSALNPRHDSQKSSTWINRKKILIISNLNFPNKIKFKKILSNPNSLIKFLWCPTIDFKITFSSDYWKEFSLILKCLIFDATSDALDFNLFSFHLKQHQWSIDRSFFSHYLLLSAAQAAMHDVKKKIIVLSSCSSIYNMLWLSAIK